MTNLQTITDQLKEAELLKRAHSPRPRKLRIVPHLISTLRVWSSRGIFRENAGTLPPCSALNCKEGRLPERAAGSARGQTASTQPTGVGWRDVSAPRDPRRVNHRTAVHQRNNSSTGLRYSAIDCPRTAPAAGTSRSGDGSTHCNPSEIRANVQVTSAYSADGDSEEVLSEVPN
jgi:hypothetical protein